MHPANKCARTKRLPCRQHPRLNSSGAAKRDRACLGHKQDKHDAGEALQKLGIPCEVVTPGSGWRAGRTAAEARNNVSNVANPREWDRNGLDRGHLALRFRLGRRTYTWDSDAMHRSSMRFGKLWDGGAAYTSAGKWGTGLTVEECKAMSSTRDGWNSDFKRKHIPAMRRITKTVLLH